MPVASTAPKPPLTPVTQPRKLSTVEMIQIGLGIVLLVGLVVLGYFFSQNQIRL
jgi:hypothetical protein